jgi:hypothetical protein
VDFLVDQLVGGFLAGRQDWQPESIAKRLIFQGDHCSPSTETHRTGDRQPLQGTHCRQGSAAFNVGSLLGDTAIFGQLSLAGAPR